MLKIGIIGTLDSVTGLSSIISGQTTCTLSGIYDPDPDPDLSLQLPGSCDHPLFTSYQAFLSQCEAVIVDRTSNVTSEQIIEALRCSKHVLLNKPLDWSDDEIEYLIKLADEANTLLKLRESFLFHPACHRYLPFYLAARSYPQRLQWRTTNEPSW